MQTNIATLPMMFKPVQHDSSLSKLLHNAALKAADRIKRYNQAKVVGHNLVAYDYLNNVLFTRKVKDRAHGRREIMNHKEMIRVAYVSYKNRDYSFSRIHKEWPILACKPCFTY